VDSAGFMVAVLGSERFARTKEAKTGQKSRTPRIFFPFIGFCRSLLAERTDTLSGKIEHVRVDSAGFIWLVTSSCVRDQLLHFFLGDCPNARNVTYARNVLSVIQAKIWPKKHVIRPKRGNRQKR
jgi:hypothetical protein